MNRAVAVTLALFGCSEYGIGEEAPQYDNPAARPVEEGSQTDVIVQVTTPKVDILWMVDNSCSMADDQKMLTDHFPLFMDFFVGSGLDYHIGVTSSDLDGNYNGSKGKLVEIAGARYLVPDTANPIEMFTTMATLGTNGSGTEKGMGAVYLALEINEETTNSGFYRDEAALHTIIISDEPDLTPGNVIDQGEFENWYDGLKTDTDERTFSSIVDPQIGSKYKNITLNIGGINWDIKQEQWGFVLEQLGIQAAGLKREYYLSQRPIEGTITVSVEDASGATYDFVEGILDPATGELTDTDADGLPDGDWSYESMRNSITFAEFIPNPLSKVIITYTLLSTQQAAEDFEG
jgi:hypothetical protein